LLGYARVRFVDHGYVWFDLGHAPVARTNASRHYCEYLLPDFSNKVPSSTRLSAACAVLVSEPSWFVQVRVFG
jgi:hypothetical protein